MSRRRRRAWLPHPAATLVPRVSCPTGLYRFASIDTARSAMRATIDVWPVLARECPTCAGVHVDGQTFGA